MLGETADFTYFVLADDYGNELARALESYAQDNALKSFFDVVDQIQAYGPEDRRGFGLDTLSALPNQTYKVDVSIWPAGNLTEARARADLVGGVVESSGGQVLLSSVTTRRSYLRVEVSHSGLADLLDTSVVETVRTPPVPFLDFHDWRELGEAQITRTAVSSGVVGILDDSPESSHPLLRDLVLSDDNLAPAGYAWARRGSHGTGVAGRVLYPDLHRELREMAPLTSVGAVRVVRVLEQKNTWPSDGPRFPTYALPQDLVEQAVRHLHSNYGVRVFNLSFGYAEPFNEVHVGPLTELIDELVRELDVVIVVPTGNAPVDINAQTASGHHIIDDKPAYFATPEHRLAEPAPAALAVTVGSIALSGAAAEMPGRIGWIAASEEDELSPFSRTGPGLGTAEKRLNKPDVVHHGGNFVVNDSGMVVKNDLGASLVSTSYSSGGGRLFAAVNGTSFATPAIARIAADVAHRYPDASANLIRSLLVGSAIHPEPASSLAENHDRHRAYGYGLPDRDRALSSDSNRVTMIYDGQMPVDTVQIHPLPVPEVFRRGSGGERSISVSLAFDPPVRRQRREYLAATMKIDVYRNTDLNTLADILQRQDPEDPADIIRDRRRLKLEPGSNSFTNSTTQVRTWTARNSFSNDDETFFIVVTHKAQVWARDDPEYAFQRYALAATLEDRHLVELNLYQELAQRAQVPARVRVRN